MLFDDLLFVVIARVLFGGHSVVVACKAVSDFGGAGVEGGGGGERVVVGGGEGGDMLWMKVGF